MARKSHRKLHVCSTAAVCSWLPAHLLAALHAGACLTRPPGMALHCYPSRAEWCLLACAGQGQLPTNRQPSAEARAKRPAGPASPAAPPAGDDPPPAASPSPGDTPDASAGKQSFAAVGKPSKRMAAALAALPGAPQPNRKPEPGAAAGPSAFSGQSTGAAPTAVPGAGSARSAPSVQSAAAAPAAAAYAQAMAQAVELQRGAEALAASAAALAPQVGNLANPRS